ncbi:hypothetical protein Ddye_010306 [Dipteronia dyeriana]|uniref:Cytochrome P450 n=1 Tax=Dipteronia dyeriana TaxID=168575 RepID=A0AAD9XD43_9ROSI|nr:hypothetical protein Ddye_010306 [Dipteronia dyeriana]
MAFIGLFEVFLTVVCFFILHHLTNNNNGHPKNFLVVGMLPELLLNVHQIHDWCTQILERCQCTFLFNGPWFSRMDILVTADPANIHYIMSSNFTNYPKGPEFKQIFDVLGDGIFNSDSDSWKNKRKVALALINHQSFHRFMLKTSRDKVENGMIPILEHVSKQDISVDLQDLFQRFTFDSTCILVTGYDPGCLSVEFPQVLFSMALEDAEESIFYRHIVPETLWKLQRWLGIGEEKKMKRSKKILDEIIVEYIRRKRSEDLRKLPAEGVDLLTSYMNHGEKDDKFLRDTFLNFMIAGRDTTASALTWFFWLVSKNPEVETRIREELESRIPDRKSGKWLKFDIQELNKLVYLHGAISEALRLYPPVPFQHKAPVKLDVLPSGHRVVPSTKILFSLYALGRMKSVWGEDCLEFKPERWITERGGIKREASYKFLAFNAGPRTCIGKEVAFTQIKIVAASIIHNYNVQVVEDDSATANCPNVSIILQMKHGLKVRVFKRWQD